MRTKAAVALLVLAGVSFEAVAQVVTPPPAPKPKEEYVPPSERPAPAPPPRPTTQPAQPAQPQFDPTTVEFEPIYTRAEDGTIIVPEGSVEVAAIMNNPLIDDDIKFVIEELLKERETRAEGVVTENAREAIEYALGVVDRMDFGDQSTVQDVARVAQELQMGDGAIADLSNQGVLTDQARAMSVHIWQDYNQAMTASLAERFAEAEDQNALLNAQSRFLMGVSMEEIGLAFDRVARRALGQLDSPEAGEALGLAGTEFRAAAGAILDRLSDERLAEVFQ